MLSVSDLDYAQNAAQDWYMDQWGGLHSELDDIDLCRHFGGWFRMCAADGDSLDIHIPSAFNVWRTDVLPLLGVTV